MVDFRLPVVLAQVHVSSIMKRWWSISGDQYSGTFAVYRPACLAHHRS